MDQSTLIIVIKCLFIILNMCFYGMSYATFKISEIQHKDVKLKIIPKLFKFLAYVIFAIAVYTSYITFIVFKGL